MEENQDTDIIYDLDQSSEQSEISEQSEGSENLEQSEQSENSDNADNADNAENSENAESDPATEELQRMVEKMGAETLLEIIRDNRNAAIRQIISEVEASQVHTPPSGNSCATTCSSIFDLAALA